MSPGAGGRVDRGGFAGPQHLCKVMHLKELQQLVETMYSAKDRKRGSAGTFLWLMEEIGELAAAIAEGTHADKQGEFADVLAWVVTLANIEGVDLEAAVGKYANGCPGCGRMTCLCHEKS